VHTSSGEREHRAYQLKKKKGKRRGRARPKKVAPRNANKPQQGQGSKWVESSKEGKYELWQMSRALGGDFFSTSNLRPTASIGRGSGKGVLGSQARRSQISGIMEGGQSRKEKSEKEVFGVRESYEDGKSGGKLGSRPPTHLHCEAESTGQRASDTHPNCPVRKKTTSACTRATLNNRGEKEICLGGEQTWGVISRPGGLGISEERQRIIEREQAEFSSNWGEQDSTERKAQTALHNTWKAIGRKGAGQYACTFGCNQKEQEELRVGGAVALLTLGDEKKEKKRMDEQEALNRSTA